MDAIADVQVGASELVGREAELARVLGHFKQAERGAGSVVVVRGSGGIGKSRLVAEVARRATAMGALAVTAHAATFDRGLPYALLGELIAGLPDDLSADVAGRKSTLSGLLGIGGARTGGKIGGPSDVLSAATGLMGSIAEHRPLVAIWEDLHEADADSVLLFMRLSRWLANSRVLLIGTLRSPGNAETHELERLVDKLEVEGRGSVVDLGPLDVSEVRAMVGDMIGAEPDQALVDFVYSSSRGNPFFTSETTRSLVSSASIAVSPTRARLLNNGNLLNRRTALVHRFFQIGSVEARVARVLSAFGRVSLSHLSLVAMIAELPEPRVVTAFDQLVARQLLVRQGDSRFEFAHSILREALYDDLGPAEQRRIHGLIAARLASDTERGDTVDVTELATHLVESADPGDPRAAEVLIDAGRFTFRTAPLVAAGWFSKAAQWQPAQGPHRAELLALEAAAMFRASRPKRAAELGSAALLGLPQGPLRQRTLSHTVNSFYISADLQAAVDLIDREEATVGELSVPLRAQRAHFVVQLGLGDRAEPMYALEAEGLGPVELSIAMSHDLHRANVINAAITEPYLIAGLEELLTRSSPQTQLAIHGTMALAYVGSGDPVRLATAIDAAAELRPDRASLTIGGQLEVATLVHLLFKGRWDDALAFIPDLAWDLQQSEATICEGLMQFVECEIYLERGQYRKASAVAATFVPRIEGIRRSTDTATARVELALGNVGRARQMLEDGWSRVESTGLSGGVDVPLFALVETCMAAGDVAAAEHYLRLLDEFAALTASPLTGVRALLSRSMVKGDVEAARTASSYAGSLGLPFLSAKARLLAAESGDDVADNLVAAYQVFDEFGALPWRQRAAAQMRIAGLQVPRQPATEGDELSQAESRLARMVSEGMTNNEIATVLNYSVKTIEVYLTRLYAKTHCRSRTELGVAVTRGELLLAPEG